MSRSANTPLIEVEDLSVRLNTSRGVAQAIRKVSFSLLRGETLGLVGESGCGKSVTALALMGLLPDSAVVSGSVQFVRYSFWAVAAKDSNKNQLWCNPGTANGR